MLKTLKWVYDLGVKHERVRIARYLEAEAARHANEFGMEHDMLREMRDTSSKSRKQRLEVKHAVTMRVSEIVDSVLSMRTEEKSMISVMFPDEEKK